MNRQVVEIGRIIAIIGGVLSILEIVLQTLSLSVGFSNSRGFFGNEGIVGTIINLGVNLLIVLIGIRKIKINDLTLLGIVLLVLALVAGNLLAILGSLLLLIGVYMK
ncbi:MAG: hypothetical protein D6732_08800 [Methanobacteriota archaeon]|nr:MAG: hypothetical protein D6732_08800 [Euryarchaeota archaeon]